MFFRFSGQLLSKEFFILRITEGDMIKNAFWYSCKAPRYSCPILMEFEFFQQISEKYSNIIYHETLSSGRQVIPSRGQIDRRTDKHDEAYCRFSQFCESG
jgi:hypothetical protein